MLSLDAFEDDWPVEVPDCVRPIEREPASELALKDEGGVELLLFASGKRQRMFITVLCTYGTGGLEITNKTEAVGIIKCFLAGGHH